MSKRGFKIGCELTYRHTSVRVTRELIEGYHACANGIADIEEFLPATLHTDVEKNIPLALELADAPWAQPRNYTAGADRVWWLLVHVLDAGARADALPDNADGLLAAQGQREPFLSTQLDAWIIAQWLAWIADALATKEGR